MPTTYATHDPIMLKEEELENVTTFEYLGSKTDESGGPDADVTARQGQVKIWSSTALSIRTKMRLFQSNVMSVLLYGAEIWFLNKVNIAKLQTHVNKCLRRVHGPT